MKTRLILGPLLLLFVAGLMYLDFAIVDNEWLTTADHPLTLGFIALASFAAIVGSIEVCNMFAKRELHADRFALLVGGVTLIGGLVALDYSDTAIFVSPLSLLPLALMLAIPALLLVASWRGLMAKKVEDFLPRFAATLGVFLYVLVPVAMMIDLSWQTRPSVEEEGLHAGLCFIIWMIMACRLGADSCAYFAGKGLGKNKMIPHVSPGKTWEGFVGGVVGAIGMSVLAGYLMPNLAPSIVDHEGVQAWILPAMGAVIGVVAPMGDLVASALKRGAGVKDSGNLLPEFGGIIDLIDGFLLVAPVIWVVVKLGEAYPVYSSLP